MKARATFVQGNPDDHGVINLRLEAQTDEDKKLFRNVFEEDQGTGENSLGVMVAGIGSIITGKEVMEMEIIFPKDLKS